jgi:hypothetical protein
MSEVTKETLEKVTQFEHAKLDEVTKFNQWRTPFNELCDDGVFRPIFIFPTHVVCVRRLDVPQKIGEYEVSTVIAYRETHGLFEKATLREIFVFEDFRAVLMALGTAIAAGDCYASNFYYTGCDFKKRGIKWFPERQPLEPDVGQQESTYEPEGTFDCCVG